MATIPSYPQATPGPEDLLLGINVTLDAGADSPKTRTFTVGSIVELASNGVAGPPGPTGAQGAEGIQGPRGLDGAVGPAGLNWRGTWTPITSYIEDDAVGWNGASWFCILAIAGSEYPNLDTTHWALLASQGAQGFTGPQGPTGAQGSPGSITPIIASSPLTGGTITTTGTIGISAATNLADGYITKEAFATFTNKENSENKQNSLAVDGTGTKFPTVDAVNLGITNSNYWTKTDNDIVNTNSGNVGIGTTTAPIGNTRLVVKGTGAGNTTFSIKAVNSGGGQVFSVDDQGNINNSSAITTSREFGSTRGYKVTNGTGLYNGFAPYSGYLLYNTTFWQSDIKLKYASDLSASYDDRTLVDKGYVNNRLVVETTSGHTLTNADSGGIIIFKTIASQTLTIPTLSLADGFECTFVTLADVTLTVVSTGNTLNNAPNPAGSNVLPPKSSFTLKRMIAANTFIATGNL